MGSTPDHSETTDRPPAERRSVQPVPEAAVAGDPTVLGIIAAALVGLLGRRGRNPKG
jgi:hypothetical protein